MRCKFSSPVEYKDCLYGLDEGQLVCLDMSTGDRRWKGDRYGHGQILRTGDVILVLGEEGQLALVEANPAKFIPLGTHNALKGSKTWNPPALVGGKAFVRNHEEMACYDLADQP